MTHDSSEQCQQASDGHYEPKTKRGPRHGKPSTEAEWHVRVTDEDRQVGETHIVAMVDEPAENLSVRPVA